MSSIKTRTITETAGAGRLGRHVEHDARSLNYLVEAAPAGSLRTVMWTRRAPIFDQGDVGSCHDAETEILTSTGWLPFPDLTVDHKVASVDPATSSLIFEQPVRVIDLPWDDDLYVVRGNGKDFAVTPDHMMMVRLWNERVRTLVSDYTLVPMRDIGWYSGLMTSVKWDGTTHADTYTIPGVRGYKHAASRVDLTVPMQAWLRLLGIYLAEGTMLKPTSKAPHKIQIAASKDREKDFVRSVFADLGIRGQELRDRFTFEHARIYQHMQELGLKGVYASEKYVPAFVFDLPAADIAALLDGHRNGDGSFQNGIWTHYTSSPQLADDLQRLIFLSGGKSGRSSRPPRSAVMKDGREVHGKHFELAIRHLKGSASSIERKREVRTEHYTGRVYCAEVPTFHTLVTRRNGKVLISGNCTGNATTGLHGTDSANREGDPDLSEVDAVRIYSAATHLDRVKGVYPPDDTGSSGLAAAKAGKAEGWWPAYRHALGLNALLTALQSGPVMVGTEWLTGADNPVDGIISVTGQSRGGHEYEILGCALGSPATTSFGFTIPADHVLMANSWGTSWGVDGYAAIPIGDAKSGLGLLLAADGDCTLPVYA